MAEASEEARPPDAPPADPIETLCAAHGPVDSAGRFAAGTIFGDWRLTAFIGRGGSGEVYCAEHASLGTPAAVKVLARADERAKIRFLREAKLLAGLTSDAFPHFFAYGESNGCPYIAMELLEPGDLPAGERAIARFLLKVCGAVAELHAQGFVHRDIKPSNILWRRGGPRSRATAEPVLADLGLVKDVTPSDAGGPASSTTLGGVGTPGYGAPEQMERGEVTIAADIHALGVLADHCFEGRPPQAWARVIQRATSSIPARRYPSVPAFARAIRWRLLSVNARMALACVGALAAVGMALAVARHAEGTDPAERDEARSTPAGPVIDARAMLNGTDAKDARWFLDNTPIEMPYRFPETDASDADKEYRWLQAVVQRDGKSYSAKRNRISANWKGVRKISMTLREDPAAGTSIRIWTPDGIPFDFVWCPPGEDAVSCVDSGMVHKAQVSVGYGYWIAKRKLTCRQFGALSGTGIGHRNAACALRRNRIDRSSDLPAVLDFRGPDTVPEISIPSAGVMFRAPGVMEWEHAACLGGGLPSETEMASCAWTRADAKGMSAAADGTSPCRFKGGQKRPNALGLYDVYGNVSEWVWVSSELKPDNEENKGGWTALGGSCVLDGKGLRAYSERAARILCGLPAPVCSVYGLEEGKAGVRFVAASFFENETNTVLYSAAKGLLRSDTQEDRARGEAMMKGFLGSDDSVLDYLARGCCIERGLLSLEECGTNTPSMFRLAAIKNGNPQVLEKLATTDPDPEIRDLAYESIQSPSDMVSARYVALVELMPGRSIAIEKYFNVIRALTDRAALSFVAEHARLDMLRQSARERRSKLDKESNVPEHEL